MVEFSWLVENIKTDNERLKKKVIWDFISKYFVDDTLEDDENQDEIEEFIIKRLTWKMLRYADDED